MGAERSSPLAAERTSPPRWQVALALGIVYVVWGSTYAAIRVALDGFPTFLLGATRFLAAGAVLFLIALALRQPFPRRAEARDAAFVGFLFLFLGNGGVVWAEHHVASGLAAMIVATVPLWMVLLDALHPRGARLTAGLAASTLLGLAGVGVLMAGGIAIGRGTGFWLGVLALLGASFAWSVGGIYGHHAAAPRSQMMATAVQMLAGGAALTVGATLNGEWGELDPARIAGAPLWANLYLIVFGSLVAFSAFAWLVRSAPPALVGTYAFVNPVIALLLGALFLGETFDTWMLAGSLLILVAVVSMQMARRRAGGRTPGDVASVESPYRSTRRDRWPFSRRARESLPKRRRKSKAGQKAGVG